ncbi:hypothetical protein M6D93_15400 [Jatrophihabitans telluris]|uniref:Integral membrane protein n=1 Tax=Jatrophihabitans telluris TaxID=2038343 RepID=A0ABY4QXV6_9ACTN|nr:hypothetical protein [Jatrophihabitans telluris]UQX87676.1 hypothetical protein M6D93_15400 [Jatrophihabitans telluris]
MSVDFRRPTGPDRWLPAWFLLWMLVGVGGMLSLLTILTIGIFVLPVTVVIVLALALLVYRRPAVLTGVGGALAGPALPLWLVAYLNRDGPGTVCTRTADGGSSCADEWSPWPFFFGGLAFVVLGVLLTVLLAARARASRVSG